MIFLILVLSCAFKSAEMKDKGKRESFSRAIHHFDDENSKILLKSVDKYTALSKGSSSLFPIEEALEVGNTEAVKLLINIEDCQYPASVYEKMVDNISIEILNLIPEEYLTYKLLLKVKEKEDIGERGRF